MKPKRLLQGSVSSSLFSHCVHFPPHSSDFGVALLWNKWITSNWGACICYLILEPLGTHSQIPKAHHIIPNLQRCSNYTQTMGSILSEALRRIGRRERERECVFHMFSHDAKSLIKEACMRKQRPGTGTVRKDKWHPQICFLVCVVCLSVCLCVCVVPSIWQQTANYCRKWRDESCQTTAFH